MADGPEDHAMVLPRWKSEPPMRSRCLEVRLIGGDAVSAAAAWRDMPAAARLCDLGCRQVLASWALLQLGGAAQGAAPGAAIVAVTVGDEPGIEGPARLSIVLEALSDRELDEGEKSLAAELARRRALVLEALGLDT